jgi:hypothetical protein
VWELDISGAERLLFHYDSKTIWILAVGGHEIVSHYRRTGSVAAELLNACSLPQGMTHLAGSGFFTFDVESEWKTFANEADPSWLSYLDQEQSNAVDDIIQQTKLTIADERLRTFTVILGGPGTGKTTILLNLFCRLIEMDVIPQVIIEDQVAEFLEQAGAQDLKGWRVSLDEAAATSHGGLLLLDDPRSIKDLERAKRLVENHTFASVVAAVDPLQLSSDATDADIRRVRGGSGSAFVQLSTCYRQKETVGRATKKALDSIALSSPFYREDKQKKFASEREEITRASNELTFTNPSGRSKVYPAATISDIRAEAQRLQRAPGLWSHTAPYLIVEDDEYLKELPEGWREEFEKLKGMRWLRMSEALSVKGIEFQHVVIILSETLFLELENGFEGASRGIYDRRRLYRIPLSRAKDSITVFVVGTPLSKMLRSKGFLVTPLMRRC